MLNISFSAKGVVYEGQYLEFAYVEKSHFTEMKGIAAVWIGGATAVLATSSTAVAMQNSRKNDTFQEDVALSYRNHWNNKRVNRDATRYPLLQITKGACFAAFFPGVDLPDRPKKVNNNQEVSTFMPSGFSLKSGQDKPVGCKLMKMSIAKENVAFGYLSETTVRNGSYGMAVYGAATNLKHKDTTDSEYWVLFLKKNGDNWSIIGSGFWTSSLTKYKNKNQKSQEKFYIKLPTQKSYWQWDPENNKADELKKLMDLQVTDTPDKWQDESKDKLFSRLWFGGDETGDVVDELFYEGSNERFFIREHFKNQKPKSSVTSLPFLKTISLEHKGSWKDMKRHCESHYALSRRSLSDWERNICFSQPKEK